MSKTTHDMRKCDTYKTIINLKCEQMFCKYAKSNAVLFTLCFNLALLLC